MKKNIEKWIEDALTKEPELKLSNDFSYKVVKAIKVKEKQSQRKIYLWMTLGILFMCGAGVSLIVHFFPNLITSFSSDSQMNNLIPMAIVIGVLVVLIQYLDKKLIKDRLITR